MFLWIRWPIKLLYIRCFKTSMLRYFCWVHLENRLENSREIDGNLKENIRKNISNFYRFGVSVKWVTTRKQSISNIPKYLRNQLCFVGNNIIDILTSVFVLSKNLTSLIWILSKKRWYFPAYQFFSKKYVEAYWFNIVGYFQHTTNILGILKTKKKIMSTEKNLEVMAPCFWVESSWVFFKPRNKGSCYGFE